MRVIKIIFFVLLLSGCSEGIKCEQMLIGHPDLYCERTCDYCTNHTREIQTYKYILRNSTNERLIQEELQRVQQEKKQCFDTGEDYYNFLDLQEDYNLNCSQIEYINDHFVDNIIEMDGGSIEVTRNGFLSSISIDTELKNHIVTKVLATGKLVKSIKFHEDCKGKRDNEVIFYWKESDFIMYYTYYCIGVENQ